MYVVIETVVVEPTHELAPVQLGDYYNILESFAEDSLCVCACE